jgi:ribonucleoside-diphosphate reductase alpha chain
LRIVRHFTDKLVDPETGIADIFSNVELEFRDVILNDKNGNVIFEQRNVVVPKFWSETASTILATKYFRGKLGTDERETSLEQVVCRIVGKICETFEEKGYGSDEESWVLHDELTYMLVHQIMAFNSPVWFNVGVKGVPQQVSACFILDVDDDMEAILDWYKEEGLIFKGGSGAGVNLSKIRSRKESLRGGGSASGPVSFMRGADASAGTIKSGGKTRRAAKMVVLDADHPDIEEFIWCKALEENKIRALADAGFDVGFDGKDLNSIQYQNANNTVRVTDDFMYAF